MKKIAIFLCAALLCAGLLGCSATPVETEAQAVELAKTCVEEKFEEDFSSLATRAEQADGLWVVTFYEETPEDGSLGGGYPVVKIDPDTGKIVSALLSK